MRKHNDGYALVLVLVVMVVLCLVALALMSNSLRNLQSQQKSIERMEDKYAAEGAVEIVVAKLSNLSSATGSTAEDAVKKAVGVDNGDFLPDDEVGALGTYFTYTFLLTETSGNVQIECELELAGKISMEETGEYTIKSPVVTYNRYEITNVAGAASEGGDGE